MATSTPSTAAAPVTAARPRVHLTAPTGWLNDPHGICWAGGEYHLFFQYVPDRTEWAQWCHWGHAVSPDLVRWKSVEVALSPRPDEGGCWTGAAVVEDGRPTIFYTSVLAANQDLGRVALAFPDDSLRHWTSNVADIVIDSLPPDLDVFAFRDPCMVPTADGWTMVVGVGVRGGTGLVVQYTSTDRRHWSYDGVVCARPTLDIEGTWTGSVWECPQLFRVGDDWVLVVSVWDDGVLHYVAGAVGTYDGHVFVPESWSRLTDDDTAYAMTSFADHEGRPCAMFWLREERNHDPDSRPWAGALSLPMTVAIRPDRRLRLLPHPDVDTLRRQPFEQGPSGDGSSRAVLGVADIQLSGATDGAWELTVHGTGGELLRLTHRPYTGTIVLTRPGRETRAIPLSCDDPRIIVDVGIVAVFAGTGCATFRFAGDDAATVTLDRTAATAAAVYQLMGAVS